MLTINYVQTEGVHNSAKLSHPIWREEIVRDYERYAISSRGFTRVDECRSSEYNTFLLCPACPDALRAD